jgi:AraC-like DNA-binding protein
MIENLNGIHETVNYREDTNIRFYDNTDFEAYPRHWHTCFEIIMPVRNEYVVEYDKYQCTLQEGDIIFICPGVLHYLKACEGERYIFQAELSSVSPIREVESALTIFYPALILTPENSPEIYDRLHRLLLEIVDEYNQAAPLYEASIYARLLEMVVTVSRSRTDTQIHFSTSHTKQKEYIEKFMNICDYISEHCTEPLTLDMVADLSGFSKYHFTRLFKQFTNVSFYKYLNLKRIAKAEQLLINPDLSITDVALSSGFSSLSAFIRMFKIIKGCTPSEFRSIYDL